MYEKYIDYIATIPIKILSNSLYTIPPIDSKQFRYYLFMTLQPWPVFSFLIFYTVGRTPQTGDQPVARPLPTHRTAQTQNKRTQTSMPRVGFEPMAPVFERAKTVHELYRVATVIGCRY
jgi:hypothetical protein